jgi:polysaccharide export outer membrane protein
MGTSLISGSARTGSTCVTVEGPIPGSVPAATIDRMRDASREEGMAHMTPRTWFWHSLALLGVVTALAPVPAAAQGAPPRPAAQGAPRPGTQTPATTRPAGPVASGTGTPIPGDYVIGPDDVLGIVFWRDADMTQDVTVRPDGNITLPLLGDIKAAGLAPADLREQITKAAGKLIADPNVTVVVRQINSRNVFITGGVARPGPYPVSGQMSVVQLISVAGGLTEFANAKAILIVRVENGQTRQFKFNYNDFMDGKKLEQNMILKPGDTVLVKQ